MPRAKIAPTNPRFRPTPLKPHTRKTWRGLHRARRTAGVTLIALSALGYIGVFAAPFLGLSAGRMAAVIAALFITAEGAFALGVLLLGKEIFRKIKALLKVAKGTDRTQ